MASPDSQSGDPAAHMERVARCCQALQRLPWLGSVAQDEHLEKLLGFDSEYWTLTRYLSLPLYDELVNLVQQDLMHSNQQPEVAVVIPVHQPNPELLRRALQSLRWQVGVSIHCLISVDGLQADLDLVNGLLDEFGRSQAGWRVEVLFSPENRGVALARNKAFERITCDVFTCCDCDDLFHPLRCLHGLYLMSLHGVRRINTSYSRVSIRQRKIFLYGHSLAMCGHNSFFAKRELFADYGYMADLRKHEDTELMQRLSFFGEPMYNSAVVGHYLNMEADAAYESLSTDLHLMRCSIVDHPYLCGSIWYELTPGHLE